MKKLMVFTLIIMVIATGCSFNNDVLSLNGDIQNEIISVVSSTSGKITEMTKEQGEIVKKGVIIARLDDTILKYTVDQLKAVVKMKKAKLDELKAGARAQQISQAEAQVRAAKSQLDLLNSGNRVEQIAQAQNGVNVADEAVNIAKTTYDFTKSQYENVKEMYEKKAVTKNELDNAKYKLDIAAKQLNTAKYQLSTAKEQSALMKKGSTSQSINSAKANYDSAKAQLDLIKSGPTAQSLTIAEADLEQSEAQLKQANYNLENCILRATSDGVIISKNYELGDVISVGSNIVDIAVKDKVYVLCYVPDEYLDKITYGQKLKVKTNKDEQSGKVSYIALKHEYTPKDLRSVSDDKHIATKIKVMIDDMDGKLKSGMEASVSINLK